MTPKLLSAVGLAAIMATGAVAPAAAQVTYYDSYSSYYDPDYARSVEDYNARRDAYAAQRDVYENNVNDYAANRAAYERARAEYDALYGYGAYERLYGPYVVGRSYYAAPMRYAGDCARYRTNRSAGGALLGAVIGGALGNAVAGHGARAEGTVLGAVVGGGIGLAAGRSSVRCDDSGYYYSYNDTYPYREGAYYSGRPSGRYYYSYYRNQRCRLAAAPVDVGYGLEYRYVRVCPDRFGRYRITP